MTTIPFPVNDWKSNGWTVEVTNFCLPTNPGNQARIGRVTKNGRSLYIVGNSPTGPGSLPIGAVICPLDSSQPPSNPSSATNYGPDSIFASVTPPSTAPIAAETPSQGNAPVSSSDDGAALRAARDQALAELTRCNQNSKNLIDTNAQLTATNDGLRNQLAQCLSQLDSLRQNTSNSADLQKKLNQCQLDLSAARAVAADASALRTQLAKCRADLTACQKTSALNTDLSKRLGLIDAKLAALSIAVSRLVTQPAPSASGAGAAPAVAIPRIDIQYPGNYEWNQFDLVEWMKRNKTGLLVTAGGVLLTGWLIKHG